MPAGQRAGTRPPAGFISRARNPARTFTFPAPIGGWNTRDPLDDMDVRDAIVMDNMIPTLGGVRIRPGHRLHSSGLGSAVETLMEYAPRGGANKLFGAAGTSIFDASVLNGMASEVVTLTGNARWSFTMHGTTGGHFLVAVNGAYGIALYDGATWSKASLTGGVVEEDLIFVASHQSRLFFLEENSTKVWYLPVYSVTGVAATDIDLAPLLKLGGKLVAVGTWSHDGGDGPSDLIVFVSSKGEAIIYRGIDPSSASTWELIGVYRIPEPVGARPVTKSGATLLIVTSQGVVPLDQILPTSIALQSQLAVTDKISPSFQRAYELYAQETGWEIVEYPTGQLVIVNVPEVGAANTKQFVYSTRTRGWCRFTGLPAKSWALFGSRMYFGDDQGNVWEFDFGFDDNGAAIDYDVQSAFSYMRTTNEKTVNLIRPMYTAPISVRPAIEARVNYSQAPVPLTVPTFPTGGTAWDSAKWDTFGWGEASEANFQWTTASGTGHLVGYRFAGAASGAEIVLNQTEIQYEIGDPI